MTAYTEKIKIVAIFLKGGYTLQECEAQSNKVYLLSKEGIDEYVWDQLAGFDIDGNVHVDIDLHRRDMESSGEIKEIVPGYWAANWRSLNFNPDR